MKIKEQAYQFHLQGLSYKEIGDKLGISKTTAHGYVKEQKLSKKIFFGATVPNNLKPFRTVPNAPEQGLNGRSEQIPKERSEQKTNVKPIKEITPNEPKNIPAPYKEITGDELIKKVFKKLNFEGSKFFELMGNPSIDFGAAIWGLPKGGKSNLAIRFADYLQEYQGDVVYIAAEEFANVTLQQKFKDIGGSKVTILETRDREEIRRYLKEKDCKFVFIDSINNADIDSEYLKLLRTENPNKAFIVIVQATKAGNFKGDQSLTHDCDIVIEVRDGIAYQKGRFSPVSEIKIFDEPLYQKNKNKIPEIKKSASPLGEIIAMKMVDLKPFDKAFPHKINTPKDTIKALTPIDIKFPSKKASNNFHRKSYTAVPLQNNGNFFGGLLLAGASLFVINAIYQANKKKDTD
jgi:hypothetical protein